MKAPSAKDRYWSQLRGFTHAASAAAKDPKFTGHPTLADDYELGYEEGTRARIAAGAAGLRWTGVDAVALVLRGPDVEPQVRLVAYVRGWKNGACFNAMDETYTSHGDVANAYTLGYSDGQAARLEFSRAAVERTGAVLSMLRDAEQAGGA